MNQDAPNGGDAPVVDAPAQPTERTAPLLDSRMPLHGQANKLISLLDKDAPADDDKKPTDDTKPADDKKPVEDEPAGDDEPEFVPDEDDDEDEPDKKDAEPLPAWPTYIYDRLPEIQVVGHEGEDGKEKVYKVKRLQELPDDFVFSSKRAELEFTTALSNQELHAQRLLDQYKREETERNVAQFQQKEALEIQRDIRALQKEKVLPEFKYKENDARFSTDPAVKEANEIYDLYQKTNAEYYRISQETGRSQYRISYREAADKYYAAKWRAERDAPKPDDKPTDSPADKETARKKNDDARKQTVTKVQGDKGANADKTQIKALRRGTSPRDVYQLFKRGVI